MSFPRYPEYKSQLSSITEVTPAHWNVMELRWVARLQSGESITSERIRSEGEYPVFGGGGLRGYTDAFTHDGEFPLIGRQGALCGNINIGCGRFWASEHSVVVSPTDGTNTRWLAEALRTMNLNQYSVSAAQPGLSVDVIRRLSIPVPPLEEQQAIASFLDRETAKIDTLVAEQQRLIALLKEKRQAVISHAVTEGFNPEVPMQDSGIELIGEVPAHWELVRLKYLVTSNSGIQMGPFGGMLLDLGSEVTGFKVYGQENTISGDFSRGSRWISGPRYHELANYHVTNGDLLLTRKGSLGNARLIEDLAVPGIIDSDTIRIRVDKGVILPQFLVLLLHESRYIGEQIGLAKRGAILPGLNTETIANLNVALPPLHEQERLLRELDKVTVAIDLQCEDCMSVVDLLRERRSALITAAITGQIDVRGLASAEAA